MTTPKLTFEATQHGFDLDAPIGDLKHINLHYEGFVCGCYNTLARSCNQIISKPCKPWVTVRDVIDHIAMYGIQSECRIHRRFVGIRPMTGGSEYDYVVVYGPTGTDPSDGTAYGVLLLVIAVLIISHFIR